MVCVFSAVFVCGIVCADKLLCCCFLFFFFQAEDGIRDFCLSRGLGDVYKRQVLLSTDKPKDSATIFKLSKFSFLPIIVVFK